MAGLDLTREFIPVGVVVLTISDSRTLETDTSGATLAEKAGVHAAGIGAAQSQGIQPNPQPHLRAMFS